MRVRERESELERESETKRKEKQEQQCLLRLGSIFVVVLVRFLYIFLSSLSSFLLQIENLHALAVSSSSFLSTKKGYLG